MDTVVLDDADTARLHKWFHALPLPEPAPAPEHPVSYTHLVNLFLIPEDIARYIDYSSVRKDECFKLTHDEYESGNLAVSYTHLDVYKRQVYISCEAVPYGGTPFRNVLNLLYKFCAAPSIGQFYQSERSLFWQY